MSHRRTLLAVLVLASMAAACGDTPEVVVQAEPAGVVEAPAPEDAVTEELEEAAPEDLEVEAPEVTPAPTPEPTRPAAEPTRSPRPAPTAPAPSPAPSSAPSEPVLVVGEDGCVTDVELGIVITCHDPAAGKD